MQLEDRVVVSEIELIRHIEINIDYILMLVKKYHDAHCKDKEVHGECVILRRNQNSKNGHR